MSHGTYSFDAHVSRDEFDAFVSSQHLGNLLQSANWANVKYTWGARRTGLRDANGQLVVAGLVLIRDIKFGLKMWYLPHGPVLDYANKAALAAYLKGLRAEARKSLAIFVKVDPPVAVQASPKEELTGEYRDSALAVKAAFERAGYQHQGFKEDMYSTMQARFVALTPAPEQGIEFEASLPKRTRTFARNARNKFVQTRRGTKADLDEFMKVIEATEAEKGIILRGREYYELLLDQYGDDAYLWLAYIDLDHALEEYQKQLDAAVAKREALPENASEKRVKTIDDEIERLTQRRDEIAERREIDGAKATLAGAILVKYGPGTELLYAGTNRNFGNITAQELLWVDAMNDQFERGAQYVNMGGVASNLEGSLMNFKSRFNPLVVEKLGEFDAPIIWPAYKAVQWYLNRRQAHV